MLLFMASLDDDSNRTAEVVSESEKPAKTVPARGSRSRSYNYRMKFRVRKRHWIFFVPLFVLNMLGLVLTIWRSQLLIDIRIVLLMLFCSALIAFVAALVLVSAFENLQHNWPRK
jgi:cytochrome b subunit of formate dehydrogenase